MFKVLLIGHLLNCRSKENYWTTADHEDYSLSKTMYKISIPKMSGSICKAFSNFNVAVWNEDDAIIK